MRSDLEAEIVEGLHEHAVVVSYPDERIKDNVSVRPR
jgi:hypothetical protein